MPLDRFNRLRPAFALADHGNQARFCQQQVREFVHARCSRGTGRSNNLVTYSVDGTNVVDDAVAEIDRQWLALSDHVGQPLMRGIAAGEQRPR